MALTRGDRDKLRAMMNKLRAEASTSKSVSSRKIFELTDPIMDFIVISSLPIGRRGTGNGRD